MTTKETHQQLRNILEKYGSPEYGDCIIDEICELFDFPTTLDAEKVKIRVFDIDYDTDGEDINLPDELFFTIVWEDDIDEIISDKISDETGFCHFGFKYEIKK